jgi:acid stress chaperone HdeB
MQKKILAALVAGLVAIIPAYAAKKSGPANIDFGAYTCEQLIQEAANSSAEDMGAVLMWLDGYLSGVSGDSELNWKDLEKFTTNLVAYCGKHGDANMLEAAEKVGIK